MRIRFYQVECGDAASIHYQGTDGKQRNIFIDAGYERTYRDILDSEIKEITNKGEQIDLWVISHIHDDHIGGAMAFIKSIKADGTKDIASMWWYNPPYSPNLVSVERKVKVSEAVSFAQGEKLSSYLIQKGKLPEVDITNDLSIINFSGLNFTILSPTKKELESLRGKYQNEGLRAMDYHRLTDISEPSGAATNDYYIKIEDFNLNTFTEDNSVENASSIAVLTKFNGKKILWLADAIPSTVITSIKNLGYSEQNPLEVDVVKVSHHGSKGNNSDELFDLIRCDKYIFSANGNNKHQLPTKECMARILRKKNRPEHTPYKFYFTFDNLNLRNIFQIDGEDVFTRWNFSLQFPENNKCLEISIG